jgi:hypothetical protein
VLSPEDQSKRDTSNDDVRAMSARTHSSRDDQDGRWRYPEGATVLRHERCRDELAAHRASERREVTAPSDAPSTCPSRRPSRLISSPPVRGEIQWQHEPASLRHFAARLFEPRAKQEPNSCLPRGGYVPRAQMLPPKDICGICVSSSGDLSPHCLSSQPQ